MDAKYLDDIFKIADREKNNHGNNMSRFKHSVFKNKGFTPQKKEINRNIKKSVKESKTDNDIEAIKKVLNIVIQNKRKDNKGGKPIRLKDIVKKKHNSIKNKINIGKNLNIKNKKNIYYIEIFITIISVVITFLAKNPKVYELLVAGINDVLNRKNGYIIKFFNIIMKTISKSTLLTNILKNVSFKKIGVFIAGIFNIFFILKSKEVNKDTTTAVMNTGLDIKYSIPIPNKDTKIFSIKHIKLNDIQQKILKVSGYDNIYDVVSNSLNLNKLGLNCNNISTDRTMISFGYDDLNSMLFVEIHEYSKPKYSNWIYPKDYRIDKIKEYKETIKYISSEIHNIDEDINSIRSTRQKINVLEQNKRRLEKEEEDLEDLLKTKNIRKGTPVYNKKRQLIVQLQNTSKTMERSLEGSNKKEIDPRILNNKFKKVSEIEIELKSINTVVNNLNISNYNYYYPLIENKLNSFKGILSTIDNDDINLDILKSNQKPVDAIKHSSNLNTTQIVHNVNNIIDDDQSLFKPISMVGKMKHDIEFNKMLNTKISNPLNDKLDEIDFT